jgi:hypothetical protein
VVEQPRIVRPRDVVEVGTVDGIMSLQIPPRFPEFP